MSNMAEAQVRRLPDSWIIVPNASDFKLARLEFGGQQRRLHTIPVVTDEHAAAARDGHVSAELHVLGGWLAE